MAEFRNQNTYNLLYNKCYPFNLCRVELLCSGFKITFSSQVSKILTFYSKNMFTKNVMLFIKGIESL